MKIYESLPDRNCPDEGFPDGFFMTAHEEVGIVPIGQSWFPWLCGQVEENACL